jgi:hypothetical protein
VPVLLWCLATAASVGVASLALRPVLRTASPADPVPAAATEERGNRQLITQTLPPPSPTDSPSPDPTYLSDPGSAFGLPTSEAATPRVSTTPAKLPTTEAARLVNGWTVTTGGDGVDTYLRSFRSGGGDAVIRIRGGVVALVTATPRDGYSVSRSQSESNRLVVQFTAATGDIAYIVDCMWWQDAPHGEVTKIGN